ncbi:hypothetical protein G6045_19785 [Streptomyces sp. YC504]|uniref:Uncharacterized protein n=1 Tax=Streptomyces mesophilus TaxID=1775132 RepID=A0A6G4XKY5_9ACTN|nr:hypothetical protein [Streptomyces mesophilus]NGO77883.1 hypothetical protein [Streptomyces mesophilus]
MPLPESVTSLTSVTTLHSLLKFIEHRIWVAVGCCAMATASTVALVRRARAQAGLLLLTASALMLAAVLLDLAPEAWRETVLLGVPGWLPPTVALASYAVVGLCTRGHGRARPHPGHAPGRHRRLTETAGVVSAGLGTAAALGVHRVMEGTTLALILSVPVFLALLVLSVGNGLTLGVMLQDSGQGPLPWLALACLGPALGVLLSVLHPFPAVLLPSALAVVAGIIVRHAVVGVRLALRRHANGRPPDWHRATATAAVLATGALLLAAH